LRGLAVLALAHRLGECADEPVLLFLVELVEEDVVGEVCFGDQNSSRYTLEKLGDNVKMATSTKFSLLPRDLRNNLGAVIVRMAATAATSSESSTLLKMLSRSVLPLFS
jgi:hypothetical protein